MAALKRFETEKAFKKDNKFAGQRNEAFDHFKKKLLANM